MRRLLLLAAGSLALFGATTPATAAQHRFVRKITNALFPLTPGTTTVFTGTKDGQPIRDEVTVLMRRKRVHGVSCVVVSDVLTSNGVLVESTEDWFAQDRHGTVWYFGEATAKHNPDGSVLSREGSWRAGVNGAREGIVMPAKPRLGATFAQENFPGHANDHFTVAGTDVAVTTPYGTFQHALMTIEYTPIEPGAIDVKWYVAGIGVVRELAAVGDAEHAELESITPAP